MGWQDVAASDQVEAADWIHGRLHSFAQDVGSGWAWLTLPGRDYLLFKGSVAEAQGWEDGPNLWWPDDQAWCVASKIDFPYTYVGGTSELIDEIRQDPALEALPATVAHGISATSDTINS